METHSKIQVAFLMVQKRKNRTETGLVSKLMRHRSAHMPEIRKWAASEWFIHINFIIIIHSRNVLFFPLQTISFSNGSRATASGYYKHIFVEQMWLLMWKRHQMSKEQMNYCLSTIHFIPG